MSGHFDDEAAEAELEISCQCWICPHCFDDAWHRSDAQGCERHAGPGVGDRIVIGPTDV